MARSDEKVAATREEDEDMGVEEPTPTLAQDPTHFDKPRSATDDFLDYDSDQSLTREVDMRPDFDATWVIRNIDWDLHKTLINRASHPVRVNGSTQTQVNGEVFAKLVVANGLVEPNLKDPRLLKKYGVTAKQEERLVERAFKQKPGVVSRLSNMILDLSGFGENMQVIEEAKSAD